MSDHIPEELIIQILSRLPPKSLLGWFRCVSKSWNSLISSPEFIRQHTQQAILSKKPTHKILRYFSIPHNKELYSVRPNNASFSIDTNINIRSPFNDTVRHCFRIVGSCHGILCLSDDLFGYSHVLVLWNPAINRCLRLPMPPLDCSQKGRYMFVFGFGFDIKNKDYKVVKMTYSQSRGAFLLPPKVEIFSLSLGIWKQLDGFIPESYIVEYFYKQAVVHGKVHWTGYKIDVERKRMKSLILAFDSSDEIFVELQLPESLVIGPPMNLNTDKFGESLAIYHYDKSASTRICSIWVMKEYGVVESWSKEFNIVLDWEPGMILGFRNNSEILLTRRTGQLVSYNLETHEKMNFDIIGTKNSFFMGTYEESLVLLNEGELLLPNDNSSETDRDECKDYDIENRTAQMSDLWYQLVMHQYLTTVLEIPHI